MKRFLFYGLLVALVASPALAQQGRIGGKISDAQGGILPGVSITLTEDATGLTQSSVTNASGLYRFTALNPSTYRLVAELVGFAVYTREGLILEVGRAVTIDITMELATVAETITVTGESPMVDVKQSNISGVVSESEIQAIPINTRDFQELALLVAGSKKAINFDPTKSRVPSISFGTSATGRGINVSVDGGDNNDDAVGGVLQQYSMDAVQEFEVSSARIKAEYGRSAGGQISVVTKSGTNEFHGTAFEFFRDKTLNAETQPEKDAGTGKGPFRRHQLGFAVGGPIVQDKVFFFANYERVVEDISAVLTSSGVMYPPGFVAEHGGFGLIEQPFRRDYFTGKLTAQINQDQRVDVRFALDNNSRDGDQVGEGFTSNASQDNAATQTNELWSILARHTWTVSPDALNQFVFQANDFANTIVSPLQPSFSEPGPPTIIYPTVTFGQSTSAPQFTGQRKYQFRDDFSYALETHDLKFGGEVMRVAPFLLDVPFGSNGAFTYDSDTAALDAATYFSITAGPAKGQRDNTQYGFYAQDDWRVNDQLTLNLGIRYDLEIGTLSGVPYREDYAYLLTEHPNSPWLGQTVPLKDDKNNIAPRLGFVWDVGGRGITAIRGGWGLFYDQIILNTTLFADLGASDPPFGIVSTENPPFGPDNMPSADELRETYGAYEYDRPLSPDFGFPRTNQATIGFSHQFSNTLALDADFVYSTASGMSKMSNPNERRADLDGDGATDNESRRYYAGGTYNRPNRFRVLVPYGEDSYKGLQASLRKRFANNMQYVVNYTYGDLKGNAQGLYDAHEDFDTMGNNKDIGWLPNDVRHRFVVGGVFQLPYDFSLSTLIQLETARTAGRGADSSVDLNDNGDGGTGGHNVDWAPGPNGEPAGRGNFRGDPTYIFDVRAVKVFRTSETTNLQAVIEFFNIFNRVNWGPNYENVPESANFNQNQGELFSNQFQMQLGIRFTF